MSNILPNLVTWYTKKITACLRFLPRPCTTKDIYQNHSCKINSASAKKEILHLSWYRNFYQNVHKTPTIFSTLNEINPFSTLAISLPKANCKFNNANSMWFLLFKSPDWCALLSHVPATSLTHLFFLDFVIKLLLGKSGR